MELDIDLEPMQEALESLMLDEITIHRDAQLTGDDAWDEATGTYTPPTGDDTLLYAGRAYVVPQQTFPRSEEVGGQDTFATWYSISIPLGAGYEPRAEDRVTVTSSSRDPELVGKEFILDTTDVSTFAIGRRMRAHRRTEVP